MSIYNFVDDQILSKSKDIFDTMALVLVKVFFFFVFFLRLGTVLIIPVWHCLIYVYMGAANLNDGDTTAITENYKTAMINDQPKTKFLCFKPN